MNKQIPNTIKEQAARIAATLEPELPKTAGIFKKYITMELYLAYVQGREDQAERDIHRLHEIG